ncbi:hypothetical protein LIER_37592 [Lithospermum erythrorhizon]|uniref:Integrase catalytic domain-containing protein n=1 Tax=Lithospermum erythrorhizon TaxID=34254 RepID=A0AAV3PSN9_LITER
MGDVRVRTCLGHEISLKDVRHISDFRLNLLSSGKLDDQGYVNIFDEGQWKLINDPKLIIKGTKEGTLYRSKLIALNNDVCIFKSKVETWHHRLGHMSEKELNVLARRNLISKVDDTFVSKCVHFLKGKQHRASFNKVAQRRSRVLELVYSDVCGPMKTRTLSGCVYFVTCIDDYSRKLWTYPLKSKDQVCNIFTQFHALVERESGQVLKCIRMDNGGEYIGSFDQYCKEHRIRHEQSVPKTPQHNGLAERMNRTIVEKIRCMLSYSNLPTTCWGEALLAANQIINLSPTTILEGAVPEEIWSAKKIVRSRDVVFFEDQTIRDFDQKVPPESIERDIVEAELDEELEVDNSLNVPGLPQVQDTMETNDENIANNYNEEELEDNSEHPDQGVTHTNNTLDSNQPQSTIRTSTRVRVPSSRYPPHEYVLLTDGEEPTCFQEAMEMEDKQEWMCVMEDEMSSLETNKTFILVDKIHGQKILKNQWV